MKSSTVSIVRRFFFDRSTALWTINLYTAGINYNYLKQSSYSITIFTRSFQISGFGRTFSFFTNTIDTTLIPQTSDNYEFGIRHYFTESLFANVNIFRIDTKNEIIYNPNSFSNENLDGKTRRDGFEFP